MKRTYRSMAGVTLLEIMLVLAIAALVIVMSIRFYQNASSTNKINAAVSQLQGIMAAVENYANVNNGSYAVSNTNLEDYLPNGSVVTNPWGANVTIAGTAGAATYTITYGTPVNASDCTKLTGILASLPKFSIDKTCTVITVTI